MSTDAGRAHGSPGATAPSVSIRRVVYSSGILSVWWDASDDLAPPSYSFQLNVIAGGTSTSIAQVRTGRATSGALSIDIPTTAEYVAQVYWYNNNARAGSSNQVPIIASLPAVSSASTDPVSGQITVAWQTPPSGLLPLLHLVVNGAPSGADQQAAGGSTVLPALPPGCRAAVQLAYVTADGSTATSIGRFGPAFALPSVQPEMLVSEYDRGVLRAAWRPVDGATGYTVSVLRNGTVFTSTTVQAPATEATLQPTISDSGATYAVVVQALFSASSGPASVSLPVLLGAPAVSAPYFDGATLSATVAPPSGGAPSRYDAILLRDGEPVQDFSAPPPAAGQPLRLPFDWPPVPGAAYSLRLRACSGLSRGPTVDTPLAIVSTAPSITSVTFDAIGGGCTLSWAAVHNADTYSVAVFDGPSPVLQQSTSSPSYLIPAATFRFGGSYTAVLRASGPQSAFGPPSPPIPLPATAPAGVRVRYDGAAVHVSWEPVASPLVSGYRVSTIVGTTVTVLGDSVAAEASFPLQAASSGNATAIVQALMGTSLGAASAPVPLFPLALFLAPAGGATAPWIVPQTGPSLQPNDLVLYLPQIFASPQNAGTLPGPLQFAIAPVSGSPFAYTLTIPSTSPVWTFDTNALRTTVVGDWETLLQTLQAPPYSATPLGILTLQEAVARAMPQTFLETLYFAYGARFDLGYIDLRPGIVLRAEYESYQSLGAQIADSKYLTGFVTTAVAEYEVASYRSGASWLTGLDAFLANLTAARGVKVVPPAPDGNRVYGGGGLLDAFFLQFPQPFCRLVYPPTFLPTNSPGSPYPQLNPVFIASSNTKDLETATKNVRSGSPPGGSVASFYMRGRTTFSAMIRITANGTSLLVPVGTTVGNVLAAQGRRPPGANLPLQGATLRRARGAAVLEPAAGSGYPVGTGWDVRLDWSAGNTAWLDLPLLHGDALEWDAGGR
jgi:hypothetical protein